MIQHHELKTSPGYFEQIWQGLKTFEIRYDDRGYQRGDTVELREFDFHASCSCPGGSRNRHDFDTCDRYSGRIVTADIGCVIGQMAGRNGSRGFSGMGYVVFSLVRPKCETLVLAGPLEDEAEASA